MTSIVTLIGQYVYLVHPFNRPGYVDAATIAWHIIANLVYYSVPFVVTGLIALSFKQLRHEFAILSVVAGGAVIWLFFMLMFIIPEAPDVHTYYCVYWALLSPMLIGVGFVVLYGMIVKYTWSMLSAPEKVATLCGALLCFPAIYRYTIWSLQFLAYLGDPVASS